MMIYSFTRIAAKVLDSLLKITNWIGYISIAFITLLTFFDVSLRFLINKPITGSLELLQLGMAVLAATAIVHASFRRGHVSVDVVISRLSTHAQIILNIFDSFLAFITWAVIGYRVYLAGIDALNSHNITMLLFIPVAPFQFVIAIALFIYCLIELGHAIRPRIPNAEEAVYTEV